MGRYSRLRAIRRMDPERDHAQITRWITQYEFPWDYRQGVSVAFLRDFGVPRISQLLDRTQEFEKAGQKRYDDTLLFGYEMTEEGPGSQRSRAAVRHLNRIHARYRIPNEDFLYVLATTIVGPKRWIDRFGWRPLCEVEREALAVSAATTGRMMGIENVPARYADFEKFHDDYERARYAYDPANHRVAGATFRTVAAWYPALLRPLVARVLLALLDRPLLEALGYPEQPRRTRRLVAGALRARALLVRLGPARPESRPARVRVRSYPFGYTLDDLGPAWAQSRPLEPLPWDPAKPGPRG
ncbi:DUF2236 domain-containing protein [Streptomyces sp. NA04227]|uniref:oxygenase MpaB family protein n=1 Tax=Streptomyces sp. NA04227 TaxID=2742136 RepID=UPI00159038B9|nr:oxygenase MpaB family protein [Streptomyces sp. NA04227]QKW10217.1 DUF2236 domain-containing protein [Streptomyces sp. NA04227]